MFVRTREYVGVILETAAHQKMIEWKIAARHNPCLELPDNLFTKLLETVERYFLDFSVITVPAPSFHKYSSYPILEVAKKLFSESTLSERARIEKIFPENSGKTTMGTFSGISKTVQNIEIKAGEFVLVLDDIVTTGHTMRVTCEAIAKKGSFPCFLAIA